jgi:hypothetical protein
MHSHYQQARELLRQAQTADTPELAALLIAEAQVHATLALVDATRESR